MSLHGSKSSRNRLNLLEQAKQNAISTRIKELTTTAEKRQLIAETNPLLYLFGTVLNPTNWSEQYENQSDITCNTNPTNQEENHNDLSI